jgi:CopG family nickel-responsive transcriptional regulator
MSEKITRVSLALPNDLLRELNGALKSQGYASRSEAVRDAIRDFLASYRWRQELRGEQLGALLVVYEHDIRGLTDSMMDIQHANREIIGAVQHVHLDDKHCLEALIVKGRGSDIRRLVDRLGALRGVKQAKLVTMGW